MKTKITIALTIAALLLVALSSWAQVSSSSITGQVTDSTGAVIAGAKVQAKNEASGVTYESTTTGTGNYNFASLTPGQYTITVTQKGFQTYVSTRNALTVGQPLVVDVSLKVGAQNESVQVESSYERIETTNATISDVMTETQIKNLPLNGRNPLTLVTLEPGVVQRTTNSVGGTYVFGSRNASHNITIDGIDANESTVPNLQSNIQRLNPDNVQEFRTVTLGATAETGRNSGANVMIGTRGGGNAFHGDVFHAFRNNVLNSNEWFNNYVKQPRAKLNLNQWGFDVGGPIVKNRTFFFFSYQGNDIRQSASIEVAAGGTPLVLTPSMRNGTFRFVRGSVTANGITFTQSDKRMVDAGGNLLPGIPVCGGSVKGNCVDSYQIGKTTDPKGVGFDPKMAALITSLPAANAYQAGGDGLNNAGFAWNPPTKFTGPNYYARVDHKFNDSNNIFVRWLSGRYDTKEGDFLNVRPRIYPGFPPLGEVGRLNRNLAVSYRHTFSPNLVNEFTTGFNRFAFNFTFGESNPGFGDPSKDPPYFDNCVYGSTTEVTPAYCVSPHTQRGVTTPQFIDNLSWVHGNHTIRTGFNFRFYEHNDSRGFFGGTILAPGVVFSGTNRDPFGSGDGWLGLPAAVAGVSGSTPSSVDLGNLKQAIDELAGLPYSLSQSFFADFGGNKYVSTQYATVYTRAHQYDTYIQDEWKVRPNLTLNAGLRWELNPAPFDAKQTLVPNVFPDGSQGTVTWVKADRWTKNNNLGSIGPRIGIAYAPDNKTSIRMGYAWLFDTLSTFQATAIAGKMPGFMQGCRNTLDTTGTVGVSAGCSQATGLTGSRIASGYPLSMPAPTQTPSNLLTPAAQVAGLAPSLGAFDPNLKNPSVHEWSLTVQRELPFKFVSEVGYIGKRGTHLYRAYDLNQGDVNKHPDFVSSFNVARQNVVLGCNADGTGCPAGVTGTTPSVLLNIVSSSFLNSSTTKTELIRNNIGNTASRIDTLSLGSTSLATASRQRVAGSPFPLNYFRPNPQFTQLFFQDSGGDSIYNGLYVSARRRFEQGLTFGFSYTWSKSIDDMSIDPTGASTGGGLSTTSFSRTPTDIHNFRLDRSVSDFDNTHVFLGNMLLEFPFGKGKRFFSSAPTWLNTIIGGWSTTGIFNYQSGEPWTPSSGVRTTNTTHSSTALILGKFSSNHIIYNVPNVEGPVNFVGGGFIQTPLNDPHLNCQLIQGSSAYVCIPAAGQNGSGRNTLRGPNYWNLDSGLMKNFKLAERFNLQFRAEAFNVLNHPNFENPRNSTGGSSSVTSGAFGQTCCVTAATTSTANVNPIGEPMRVLQLGLKLTF